MADEDNNKSDEPKLPEGEESFDSSAAVEAIVESTRNRADEIEEALDGAMTEKSVEKGGDSVAATVEVPAETTAEVPEKAAEIVLDLGDVEAAPKATQTVHSAKKKGDVEEPKLQIHVGKDDVRISTGHPLIDDIAAQLEKSRKFTMYAVSSLCVALLACVLFYILMSTQISKKIAEVNSMIGAVAKRTLQVTKGIETFSTLEERIGQTLINQTSLAETLAANDLAVAELELRIAALNENMQADIGRVVGESSNYLVQTRSVLQEENQKTFNTLGELQSILAEHRGMIAPISNLSRELNQVKSDLAEVRQTIGDLYIIERARMARELLDQRDASLIDSNAER
jgi:hypothetical protein|tara:strand:+ start:425 stop:1450 length:1026 start_codon:yes stop_codon:yes gene_type:complete